MRLVRVPAVRSGDNIPGVGPTGYRVDCYDTGVRVCACPPSKHARDDLWFLTRALIRVQLSYVSSRFFGRGEITLVELISWTTLSNMRPPPDDSQEYVIKTDEMYVSSGESGSHSQTLSIPCTRSNPESKLRIRLTP